MSGQNVTLEVTWNQVTLFLPGQNVSAKCHPGQNVTQGKTSQGGMSPNLVARYTNLEMWSTLHEHKYNLGHCTIYKYKSQQTQTLNVEMWPLHKYKCKLWQITTSTDHSKSSCPWKHFSSYTQSYINVSKIQNCEFKHNFREIKITRCNCCITCFLTPMIVMAILLVMIIWKFSQNGIWNQMM